jgi:hypothetical protein
MRKHVPFCSSLLAIISLRASFAWIARRIEVENIDEEMKNDFDCFPEVIKNRQTPSLSANHDEVPHEQK